MHNEVESGGFSMDIEFRANPYGDCTFNIGNTSPGERGTEYFSQDADCNLLAEKLGTKTQYEVT